MLTGERDPTTVVAAMGAGANDYMVKPFHPDQLLERVNRMIETPLQKKEAPAKPAQSRPVWEL